MAHPRRHNDRKADGISQLYTRQRGQNSVWADELSIKDQVLVVLQESGPSTAEQVAGLAGLNNGTVGNMLRGLKRNGLVNEAGKDGKAIMYESIDYVRDEE